MLEHTSCSVATPAVWPVTTVALYPGVVVLSALLAIKKLTIFYKNLKIAQYLY
jgi:hypothetical protein